MKFLIFPTCSLVNILWYCSLCLCMCLHLCVPVPKLKERQEDINRTGVILLVRPPSTRLTSIMQFILREEFKRMGIIIQVRNILECSYSTPQALCYSTWLQYTRLMCLQRQQSLLWLGSKAAGVSFLVKSWNEALLRKSAGGYNCCSLANRIRLRFRGEEINKPHKQQTGSKYSNVYFLLNKAEGIG